MRQTAFPFIVMTVLILAFIHADAEPARFSISYENGRVVKSFPPRSRPVIGLALSGGGARGIAHLGVLKTLERAGITVDRIAGTSMGSIVGGLYAAGYTPEVITSMLDESNATEIVTNDPKRRNVYIGQKETTQWPLFDVRFEGFKAHLLPSGISSGQQFTSLLSWLALGPTFECGGDFDRLHVPFRAVATNCVTGAMKVFDRGNLALAMQASSTFPGLFSPVEIDDTLYVDGGLVNNLPVSVVKDMGSDFVIAVAIEESMHPREELRNPLNLADQITSIPIRNITALSKKQADFIISPDMKGFSSGDFDPVREMVGRGEIAARDSLSALTAAIDRLAASYRHGVVRSISILPENERPLAETIISRHVTPGQSVAFAGIARGMEELWDTGRYRSIMADLDDSGLLSLTLAPAPRVAALRIVNTADSTDTVELVTPGDDRRDPMIGLIERITTRLRAIRSEEERSTLAYISSQDYSADDDTIRVYISIPHLTGIFIPENLKSRRYLITREIGMEIGEPFDLAKAIDAIDNLYGTNLYDHVYADIQPYEGGVGLGYRLKERDFSILRIGLKYDEYHSAEGRVSLSRDNMFGFGNQLNTVFQAGRRTRLLMAENRLDRVYDWAFTFNIRAFQNRMVRPVYQGRTTYYDYEDERWGMILSVGQVMDKLGNVVVQLKSETSIIHPEKSSGVKNTQREFRSFVIRSLVDSYDRYPFPRNGTLNVFYLENTGEVFGGTERFVKLFWSTTVVRTLARKHTFTGSVSLGTADPSIPESDYFSLGGGPTRLNCYNIDSSTSLFFAAFPGLAHHELTGSRLASGLLSYRLFIPRFFYLEFTYGAGNVWRSGQTIRADTLLQCYGVKGQFDTYFGQLSAGWGITSKGHDRVYISAGREF